MSYLSSIKLPNNEIYDLKDSRINFGTTDDKFLNHDGTWTSITPEIEDAFGYKSGAGSVVSFNDGAQVPLSYLSIDFSAKQDGTPWQSSLETAPYLLRQSPNFGHSYNSEMPTLIGGSIAWNQLAELTSSCTVYNITWSAPDATHAITVSGTPTRNGTINTTDGRGKVRGIYKGHKVLINPIGNTNNNSRLGLWFYTANSTYLGTFQASLPRIMSADWDGIDSYTVYFEMLNNVSGTAITTTKYIPQIVDLTATFGAEIADYAYNLEQTTEGSGIAWLKSYGFLTKDYYAYNDGSLVSVKTSEHRTTGKNLLRNSASTLTTNGITFTVNSDGSVNVNGTATANAFLEMANLYLLQAGTYIVSGSTDSNASIIIRETNAAGAPLAASPSDSPAGSGTSQFTRDGSNTIGVVLRVPSGATLNNVKIYPMIRFASVSDATFEPYTVNSYPLGNDDLRGIFKLSNGNLYADGDVKTSDGQIARKYGIVDLGTLDWSWSSAASAMHTALPIKLGGAGTKIDALVSQYYIVGNYGYNSTYADSDKILWVHATNEAVLIKDSAYVGVSSISDFTSAMSGVYLVYPLATPTTEQSTPFASPQTVSPLGTEEYVDTRDVPVPVGHRTSYADIYPISGLSEAKVYVNSTNTTSGAKIYTLNLNGTRYGGTIDFLHGVMTLTYGYVDLGTPTWEYESANGRFVASISDLKYTQVRTLKMFASCYECLWHGETYQADWNGVIYNGGDNNTPKVYVHNHSYTDVSDFKTAMNGQQLIYPLAVPQTIQLTPTQVMALQGTNYIWSNGDNINLRYTSDSALYLEAMEQYATYVANETVKKYGMIEVTKTGVSSLPITITDSNIRANDKVINSTFSNPSVKITNWNVTTIDGSLTISGTIDGTTDITLDLVPKVN